ncbi:MAG TPA: hypothetical protein VNV88_12720 [Candidatus Solibacter sp.]|nr:hypothetical protein [Candidatus Solibacter sp.]
MSTKVNLEFVDVLGMPLENDRVTVDIFSLDNLIHRQAAVRLPDPALGQTKVTIQADDVPVGDYRFQLSSRNYQTLQFFFPLTAGGVNTRLEPVVFPVEPAQVSDVAAPPFGNLDPRLQTLLSGSPLTLNGQELAGSDLYDALPPRLKAALLNLFLKSSNTQLGDHSMCFDHLKTLVELDQDRLFATIDAALVEETKASKLFHQVPFDLHKDKPPYVLFDSYKTLDPAGNLQLTFLRKGQAGNEYMVDMDIDEKQGFGHIFEVLNNLVAGLTNPYNVREILMTAQGLRPLYLFEFAKKAVVAAAA